MKTIQNPKTIGEDYAAYLTDESRLSGGTADALVFPECESDIVEIFKDAYNRSIPVTVSSGRTGIVGGAVPFGGILLSLEIMNHFLGAQWLADQQTWSIRVQSGLSLEKMENQFNRQELPDQIFAASIDEKRDTARFFQESSKWFYPPDPTEKTAHIGGTVATNASGSRSFKYGQTRRFVKRIHVVLADGTLLNLKRGSQLQKRGDAFSIETNHGVVSVPVPTYAKIPIKNTAGYFTDEYVDLMDLFIGSEGTLGVITEIELELVKQSECFLAGVAYFFSESDALRFVRLARTQASYKPAILEYFDAFSLTLLENRKKANPSQSSFPTLPNGIQAAIYFEQECTAGETENVFTCYDNLLTQCGTSMNHTWGAMDEREHGKIMQFRHALPEAINTLIGQRQKTIPALHKIGTDFAVPNTRLEAVFSLYRSKLDSLGIEYVIFGHVGENHLHVNMLPKNEDELALAKQTYLELAKEIIVLGGTLSAEHGIGKIKKSMLNLMYNPDAIQQMKNLKKSLDSKWILGRDILF